MISGPCLREICCLATQTASLSADPAAASRNNGSLCGRGCYCKVVKHTNIQFQISLRHLDERKGSKNMISLEFMFLEALKTVCCTVYYY